MITENVSTLKIHKLSQAQYDRELAVGNIDENALYLTPDTSPDWNVNDETNPSYIKNRPFYTTDPVETVIVEETTITLQNGMGQLTSIQPLEVGQEYIITLDGTTYNCVAKLNEKYNMPYVGNAVLLGIGEDTGEPFFIAPKGSDTELGIKINSDVLEHTVGIVGMISEIRKLDEKYIPDSLKESINKKPGLKVEGKTFTVNGEEVIALNGAEVFNDYENNMATGRYSHAEGYCTSASGDFSHSEGIRAIASGACSHAEGSDVEAVGSDSHAEGGFTTAYGNNSHAEGRFTTAFGEASHAEGYSNNGLPSSITTSSTNDDIINVAKYEPFTLAKEQGSHAEGNSTLALGKYSHAEGNYTITIGESSHAEGYHTKASYSCDHAEGYASVARGGYSHAEGYATVASGAHSHSECHDTIASGEYSHAEGYYAEAKGNTSHAEGLWTIAAGKDQHAQGKYNIEDTENKYAHIVGNGDGYGRSNAHTLDWQGTAWFAGNVYVGGTSQDDKSATRLATLNDIKKFSAITLTDTTNGYDYIVEMRNGQLVSYCKTVAIEVSSMPIKTEYVEGDAFKSTGMVITAVCPDGTTKEITNYTYPSHIPVGATSLTITYNEHGNILTTEVPLDITKFDASTELVDFEYTTESDGTYTLTAWKGTLNGVSSTEIVIPDNNLINA